VRRVFDLTLLTGKMIVPRRSRPVLHWARRKRSPTSMARSYLWFVPKGVSTRYPRLTRAARMIASVRCPTSTGWSLKAPTGLGSEHTFGTVTHASDAFEAARRARFSAC
jgi:hypothetical protein